MSILNPITPLETKKLEKKLHISGLSTNQNIDTNQM